MNCTVMLIDLLNIIKSLDTCVANKILKELDEDYDNPCIVTTCEDCFSCDVIKNEYIDNLIQHIEREEILSDE